MVHSNRQLNLRHADAPKRNFHQVRPLSHNIFMGYGSLAQTEKWDSKRVKNFKLAEAVNGLKTEEIARTKFQPSSARLNQGTAGLHHTITIFRRHDPTGQMFHILFRYEHGFPPARYAETFYFFFAG